MEWTGKLVVSLRGVSFGFWSRLGCSGQNVIIPGLHMTSLEAMLVYNLVLRVKREENE